MSDHLDDQFIVTGGPAPGAGGEGADTAPEDTAPIFLREKTFNPELRDLVNKINARESAPHIDDDVDSLSEEELIMRFHMLFYHVANLPGRAGTDSASTYAALSAITSEDLGTVLRDGLDGIGIHSYCILAYNMRSKCFTPVINTISDVEIYSLFLDVHDGIYRMLRESADGIFVKREDIAADDALASRFGFLQGNSWALYANSFHNLYAPLLGEQGPAAETGFQDKSLSPILMIWYRQGAPDKSPGEVRSSIGAVLAPALLMYTHDEIRRQWTLNPGTVQNTYYILEYLQKARVAARRCVTVELQILRHDPESYHLAVYLYALLNERLSGNSIICRLDRARILVLASPADKIMLDLEVQRLEQVQPGVIVVKLPGTGGDETGIDLVRELMFK
ncbi:MAG: hypothetical protein EPN93_02645 [Spirochaetes bacterium]|nr:MAG: hypothetical protein EPN93_02645 [Spirochaetota bacterium]